MDPGRPPPDNRRHNHQGLLQGGRSKQAIDLSQLLLWRPSDHQHHARTELSGHRNVLEGSVELDQGYRDCHGAGTSHGEC